jgi:hypothetical protein
MEGETRPSNLNRTPLSAGVSAPSYKKQGTRELPREFPFTL